MGTILDTIAAYAKERVRVAKVAVPDVKEKASLLPKGCGEFKKALKKDELSFICEIKKASPSKGIIDSRFDYPAIAREYVDAGADCISCLTEPKWFMGSDKIFADVRKIAPIPMIRKDFTIDEYQIYEAKCMGADCVLLICALLDTRTLAHYLEICDLLGLDALTETHTAEEIESALAADAPIIGVNSRNLKDFSVDLDTVKRLRDMIPPEKVFVAESGVRSSADAAAIASAGADAVLIGEALMRAENKAETLALMREAARV